MGSSTNPQVAILMGSKTDYDQLLPAMDILKEFDVAHEVRVLSAHRTPVETAKYVEDAEAQGVRVFIAGAGGAAHLAGAVAARTTLPVLGVPIDSTPLNGLDALLATVQMPKGAPVGTLAIGKPGAANAALLAIAILGIHDSGLAKRLRAWRESRRQASLNQTLP